jgi:hypothetical protein
MRGITFIRSKRDFLKNCVTVCRLLFPSPYPTLSLHYISSLVRNCELKKNQESEETKTNTATAIHMTKIKSLKKFITANFLIPANHLFV